MKVLVTGGAGFIGSHLVDKLITEGHSVVVVDDLSGGSRAWNNPNATYLYEDCRDEHVMDAIFSVNKFEIVFHLAANAAENKAQFSPIDVTSRNYSAFINTLTPFIKYGGKRFVFTSSIAVYGALQTPFEETNTPEPEDLYGITKFAAEQTLKVMSQVHGFEYVIARCHNVFGERQNMSDPYRNVVTIWMNAILRGKPVYIYGDGEQKRQFSYIEPVVDQLYQCGFNNVAEMIFNLGDMSQTILNDLFDCVKTVTNYDKQPLYLPLRPQEVREALAEHSLALEKLPTHLYGRSLYEEIKKTWEWVKSVGPIEPVYDKLEIDSPRTPKNWLKK